MNTLAKVSAITAAILAFASTAWGTDNATLPEPHQSGDITYITGGVGDEERDALQTVKQDYNLHILSAGVDGAFAGVTHITIRAGRNGDEVLDADAGPIFFAEMPRGHYRVEASNGDEVRRQDINVGSRGTSHIEFTWKGLN